jgi:hypothetical protein
MRRLVVLLPLLICFGCTTKTRTTNVQLILTNNNKSIKIMGLDYMILKDIAADTANNWQSLFPVYRMPADTEMKNYQPKQPGRYLLKDSALVYTPDTPFTKQQTYFVRYYQYGDGLNVWDFVKGKKRPGKNTFTDLIFKQ